MAEPIDDEGRALAKDAFAEDMARHQREFRGELPTPAANARLAAELLNRIENERADAPPEPEAPPDPQAGDEARAIVDQHAREKGWKVVRAEGEGPDANLTSVERTAALRLQARVDLLLTMKESGPLGTPSWEQRVMAALRTWMFDKRRGIGELLEVLEASNAPFGNWASAPVAPLVFA